MRILTVDDAKTIRHIIIKTLNELGYNIIFEAGCVSDAKALLAREKIDLIISDWHMPGESGLDLLHYVRGNPDLKDVLFIMNTTENDKKSIFEAVKGGVQSYMFKPVQKDVIAQKLFDLSKSHGIQAPIISPGMKIKMTVPAQESEVTTTNSHKRVVVEAKLDITKKTEITLGESTMTFVPSEIISGTIPEELSDIFMDLQIALVSGPIDEAGLHAALEALKSKYTITFQINL